MVRTFAGDLTVHVGRRSELGPNQLRDGFDRVMLIPKVIGYLCPVRPAKLKAAFSWPSRYLNQHDRGLMLASWALTECCGRR